MLFRSGMSDELGTLLLGGDHSDAEVFLGRDFNSSKNYSEATAFKIDIEVKRIVDEGYAKAKSVLSENINKLHFIAEFLVKHEVMDGEQFAYAMSHDDVTEEDLLHMVETRKKQSAEENRIAKEEDERNSASTEEASASTEETSALTEDGGDSEDKNP